MASGETLKWTPGSLLGLGTHWGDREAPRLPVCRRAERPGGRTESCVQAPSGPPAPRTASPQQNLLSVDLGLGIESPVLQGRPCLLPFCHALHSPGSQVTRLSMGHREASREGPGEVARVRREGLALDGAGVASGSWQRPHSGTWEVVLYITH